MSPGLIEETGKVATNTIEALRSQPMMLALVVLQVIVLGAVLYSSIERQKAISAQFASVFSLLDHCMRRAEPKP